MTKTILDWFHDEICNMHFRTWDVPKKKKKKRWKLKFQKEYVWKLSSGREAQAI